LKQEYPEDNYPKNIVNLSQKWLTAVPQVTPISRPPRLQRHRLSLSIPILCATLFT
jgi:hypothetical protein